MKGSEFTDQPKIGSKVYLIATLVCVVVRKSPISNRKKDVLSESGVEINGVEAERGLVRADVDLHPVVTGPVGDVGAECVDPDADPVAALGRVKVALLVVQPEALAGVLDAGLLEDHLAVERLAGEFYARWQSRAIAR